MKVSNQHAYDLRPWLISYSEVVPGKEEEEEEELPARSQGRKAAESRNQVVYENRAMRPYGKECTDCTSRFQIPQGVFKLDKAGYDTTRACLTQS